MAPPDTTQVPATWQPQIIDFVAVIYNPPNPHGEVFDGPVGGVPSLLTTNIFESFGPQSIFQPNDTITPSLLWAASNNIHAYGFPLLLPP